MPIVDIQERYRELGRIRLGRKGDRYPTALGTFRFTSPDRDLITAVAREWGGSVQPWESPRGQEWEVITDAARIDCLVPPQRIAEGQWYELWGKDPQAGPKAAVSLLRRCDGSVQQTGERCVCDPENRECKPRTHLVVMLPQIPGLGVWRVVTGGKNAASELPKTADLLARLADAGAVVKAVLSLRHDRSVKDGEVHRFVVPQLDIDMTAGELVASLPPEVGVRVLTGGSGSAVPDRPGPRPSLPPRPAAAALPSAPTPISTPDDEEGGPTVSVAASDDSGIVRGSDNAGFREQPAPPQNEPQGGIGLFNEYEDPFRLLDELPDDDATMPVWEAYVRDLFALMESTGHWHPVDDVDSLHVALQRHHKVPHLGDLRKAQLVAFTKRAHAAAVEVVGP